MSATVEPPYMSQGNVRPHSRGHVLRRCVWAAVEGTLFRWSPWPLHRFRVALLQAFGADIPAPHQVAVYPSVTVTYPWLLRLEAHTMVGPHVRIYNLARVTLRRGAQVSQHTHLCAGSHDHLQWSMPLVTRPIVIGENAWLGADVFVGPGVTIGELCVIGARAVVVKDQPAHHVCAGHPCRPIKPRPRPT
jgi:putative colanic acid biosynthesis acetyltransferase WcaF